jgi:hypothetical protein
LNISPGTSLNWTRISAFLEFNAFPAFSMKGTPEKQSMAIAMRTNCFGNLMSKVYLRFQEIQKSLPLYCENVL